MSVETAVDHLASRLQNCVMLGDGGEAVLKDSRCKGDVESGTENSTPRSALTAFAAVTDDPAVESSSLPPSRPCSHIKIVDYEDERQMSSIMRLITKDLSEPYSIYTYRYFIHNWPTLCFLALDTQINDFVGAIVCKLDRSRVNRRRGYIAMLAVDESYRKLGIGTRLVEKAIAEMRNMGCDEVVLETEVTNLDAMRLYSNLGFIREKRLFRYYLNGVDAFRLKLFFTSESSFDHSQPLY